MARVRADDFLRQRSLRLEHGHRDPDSLLDGWVDVGALDREVLTRVVRRGAYLPALRDPATGRSVRAPYVEAGPGTVVVRTDHPDRPALVLPDGFARVTR